MVLADLGRKITSALRSLSNATIINEEVSNMHPHMYIFYFILYLFSYPSANHALKHYVFMKIIRFANVSVYNYFSCGFLIALQSL